MSTADGTLTSIPIIRRFQGLYDTGSSQPDAQGLASLFPFIRPHTDDRVRYTTAESVMRYEDSFHRFVDRVPKNDLDCVPHPDPSDDPILHRPEIDFESQMVLAIISHEPNRFVEPDIEEVDLASGTMRVRCRYSAPGAVVQKIISHGHYCAVIVPRFDGEVVFIRQ